MCHHYIRIFLIFTNEGDAEHHAVEVGTVKIESSDCGIQPAKAAGQPIHSKKAVNERNAGHKKHNHPLGGQLIGLVRQITPLQSQGTTAQAQKGEGKEVNQLEEKEKDIGAQGQSVIIQVVLILKGHLIQALGNQDKVGDGQKDDEEGQDDEK